MFFAALCTIQHVGRSVGHKQVSWRDVHSRQADHHRAASPLLQPAEMVSLVVVLGFFFLSHYCSHRMGAKDRVATRLQEIREFLLSSVRVSHSSKNMCATSACELLIRVEAEILTSRLNRELSLCATSNPNPTPPSHTVTEVCRNQDPPPRPLPRAELRRVSNCYSPPLGFRQL